MSKHELETIEFSIKPIDSFSTSAYFGITELYGKKYWNECWINGKLLGTDGLYFDVFTDMLMKPGDYFPFCCSYCGDSGCACIFMPIRCFHKGDEIILVIREPLQQQCLFCKKQSDCEFDGDEFMCDMTNPVYRAHRFSKNQMRQALNNCYNIKP